jgi:hypothetical protein
MAHSNSTSTETIQLWDQKLVEEALNLYQFVWTTRNIFFHGTTKLVAKAKLRDRILEQVRDIYKNPPKLEKSIQSPYRSVSNSALCIYKDGFNV